MTDRTLGAVVLAAGLVDDIEKSRIACALRAASLRDVYGLAGSDEERTLAAISGALAAVEHQATLALRRALRRHALGPWASRTIGVGEKQLGRLLAVIGDPYWNTLYDRPRTVSELWAYCGLHVLRSDPGHTLDGTHGQGAGVAPRRQRGVLGNWSSDARTRAYLIAVSCVRHRGGPYRAVYDAGREKYADAMHATSCVRCGPSGRPALPGSPLSLGHQHARALRLVMKAVLRDLWVEAKALHEVGDRLEVAS